MALIELRRVRMVGDEFETLLNYKPKHLTSFLTIIIHN